MQQVFGDFKNQMARLKQTFPDTRFVVITVPLTCIPSGIDGWVQRGKNIIRKILGRPVFDLSDNSKRSEFNEMLRREYRNKEMIFDLARIESSYTDGTRYQTKRDGVSYDALVPEYTEDGGHLNAAGRKIVAEQFLVFLAELLK